MLITVLDGMTNIFHTPCLYSTYSYEYPTRSYCCCGALSILLHHFQLYTMGNLLYLIAVIMVIGWAIGYFAFNVSGLIHLLLVIAAIAFLLQIIRDRKTS